MQVLHYALLCTLHYAHIHCTLKTAHLDWPPTKESEGAVFSTHWVFTCAGGRDIGTQAYETHV